MNDSSENIQVRLLWLGSVIAVLFLILLGGLITRQLIQYDYFKHLAERQSLRRVLLPAPRGVITDRNGVVLASNKPAFSLIVYLGELRAEFRKEQIRRVKIAREQSALSKLSIDREAIQKAALQAVLKEYLKPIDRALGQPIPLNLEKLDTHLSQKPLMPYTLLDNLTLTQFARLTELLRVDAPLQLQVSSRRTYPQGDLACHVLGFVSMRDPELDEDDVRTFSAKEAIGISGVEKQFDESLSGEMGYEMWLVDPAGFRYEPTDSEKAKAGEPLQLTIDARLQKALEKSFGKKIGAAVALDISTGEVLSMVSKPSYNPNELLPRFSQETNARISVHNGWLNRAIGGLYPPASTFKLMTALAALEAGQLDMNETVNCTGSLEIGGREYRCHKHTGHGELNLVQALEKSCDVYFYTMGLRLGPEAIMAQARKFGLDRSTGIELPGETHLMNLPTPQWKKAKLFEPWYAGDTANVAIGQGDLLVTPLQMACLTASLARGDTTTKPTIVRKLSVAEVRGVTVKEGGAGGFAPANNSPSVAEGGRGVAELPFKAYNQGWARVIEGMKAAATTGTARLVQVEGLPINAKTGTAQVKVHGANTTLAWFVGFAPADNPQVAVAVCIEGISADDEYEGGTTAAPIARSFFEQWQKINGPKAGEGNKEGGEE